MRGGETSYFGVSREGCFGGWENRFTDVGTDA
jgi:hypothetical protein